MCQQDNIPDNEFLDMLADFGILCLAIIAFFIALLTFPFALSVLC